MYIFTLLLSNYSLSLSLSLSLSRSLKTTYELMMLSEGDFDERLFFNSQSELDHAHGNSTGNPPQQPGSEETVK